MNEFMPHQLELTTLKRDWIDDAVSFITLRMNQWGTWSSDKLYEVLPTKPEHPNWMGAALAVLRNEGLIEECGRVTSKRKQANGRRVTLWKAKTTSVNRPTALPQVGVDQCGQSFDYSGRTL